MKRTRDRGTQTLPYKEMVNKETQIGTSVSSYARDIKIKHTTHKYLLKEIINDKKSVIDWCFKHSLLAKNMQCHVCSGEMVRKLAINYSSDGYKWRCQKNGHTVDVSMRKRSWFSKSNLSLEEIVEITYLWSTGKLTLIVTF